MIRTLTRFLRRAQWVVLPILSCAVPTGALAQQAPAAGPRISVLTGDPLPAFTPVSLLKLSPVIQTGDKAYGATLSFEHLVRPHISIGLALGYRRGPKNSPPSFFHRAHLFELAPVGRYYFGQRPCRGFYLEGGVSGLLLHLQGLTDQYQDNPFLTAAPQLAAGYQWRLGAADGFVLDLGLRARFISAEGSQATSSAHPLIETLLDPVLRLGIRL